MVEPELIQKDVLAKLKTFQIYFTGITLHFAETQTQDDDFNYPAVRVMIINQIPVGNGTDRLKLSRVNFAVRVYSEKRSDYEANTVAGVIEKRLFNRQINGTDLSGNASYRLDRIDSSELKSAVRLADRLWMSEIFFNSNVTTYSDIGTT